MKIYFAWVEKDEEFSPDIHEREDEDVFNLKISQKEGGIAIAKIAVANPKTGLIPKRKQYCYISYHDGSANHLLFKGALVAVPAKVSGEIAELHFTSQSGCDPIKLEKLSQRLKVPPFWDALFVDEHTRKDPVEALEARPALYYFCRKTGEISLSGIFEGSCHIDLGTEFYRDSLKVEIGQAPLCAVDVTVSAQWKQHAEGCHDLGPVIAAQFPGGLVTTLTGNDLAKRWWKTGERIGHSPYWIEEADLKEVSPPLTGALNLYPRSSVALWQKDVSKDTAAKTQVRFKRSWFKPTLKVGWKYLQKRQESLHFTLKQATQDLVQNNQRRRRLKFALQNIVGENHHWQPFHSYSPGFQLVYQGIIYMSLKRHVSGEAFDPHLWQRKGRSCHVEGQACRSSFFLTDRGVQAFEHALEIARTHLAASARAVTIKVTADFDKLHSITTDHTVAITDDRLPGGKALGKVTSYGLYADGKTGRRFVEVTIGVAVGVGERPSVQISHNPVGTFVESGFCEDDCQVIEGGVGKTTSGIFYKHWQSQKPKAGVLNPKAITSFDIAEKICVENDAEGQNRHLFTHQYPKRSNLMDAIAEVPTAVKLNLMDFGGFETLKHEIFVEIPEPWSAPRQIDLGG